MSSSSLSSLASLSSWLSSSSLENQSTVSVFHADEGTCYETKCRGNTGGIARPWVFDDLCWTDNISDPANCAEGYKPTAIDDVAPFAPDDEGWSYFTCCPPGFEGAIERQCNSRSCSGSGNFDCWVPHGQKSKPIACDDQLFPFPNVVEIGPAFMIYSCCKTDDGSVEKYKAMDLECSVAACENFGGDCWVPNPNNSHVHGIDPMACDHDQYSHPRILGLQGDYILYSCCKTDDGSASTAGISLSPGVDRDAKFHYVAISQIVISAVAVLLSSVLVASILGFPQARSDPFNMYIVFLVIPDVILNIILIIINELFLEDISSLPFLPGFMIGTSYGCSVWISVLIASQTQKLAHQRMRSDPPTIKQVLLQCFGVYLVLIILNLFLDYFFRSGIISTLVVSVVSVVLLLILNTIIPAAILAYASFRIWKDGLLSIRGKNRSLTMYFSRIVIMFVVFSIGATIIGLIGIEAGKIKLYLNVLWAIQGGTSAVLAMTKADISKCVKKFIGLELIYAIEKKRWLSRIEKQRGWSLRDAPDRLSNDEDIVKAAIQNNPSTPTILHAISQTGWALQYATEAIQNDYEVVLIAVTKLGDALRYASHALRCNDEIITAAVRQNPTSLQFALGGKNQSNLFLQTTGLFDSLKGYDPSKIKLVLSTRFSLGENTSATATIFALLMKRNPYFKQRFNVYFPNAYDKCTCDPNWTDINHPCRGTFETCRKPKELKTGVPQERLSCWRFSYRYQLQHGFAMVQIVEYYYAGEQDNLESKHIAGDGQRIETEMANSIGRKIFRCFQPVDEEGRRVEFEASMMDDIAAAIEEWEKEDPNNLDDCELHWKRTLGSWWMRKETTHVFGETPP